MFSPVTVIRIPHQQKLAHKKSQGTNITLTNANRVSKTPKLNGLL